MLYLGSDHAGFHLKEEIKKYLDRVGVIYEDLGNSQYDEQDDFPDYAVAVADKVSGTQHKGILFCGSAIGMVIAANKFNDIRAGHVFDDYTARQSKEHDDVNVLVLAGRLTQPVVAKRLVKIWLASKFSREQKYRRRVKKILKLEQGKL